MPLTDKDYHIMPVKVWWLEMHRDPQFVLPAKPEAQFILLPKPVDTNIYRQYYMDVGFQYNWLDRLAMPDEILDGIINADNIQIFVLKINGEDAGYAEFAKEAEYVEIVYFGLIPDFIGKGYGKFFLQWVINKAWTYHPKWIQLNTCALDHPNALAVYQSAGFEIIKTTIADRKILNEHS